MDNRVVYCVRCIEGDKHDPVHIFTTPEKAAAFARDDPRDHVLYDYVLDHPERMEQPAQ